MYWMEVAVMSHRAGGRKMKGLKLGASRMGSCSERRPSVSWKQEIKWGLVVCSCFFFYDALLDSMLMMSQCVQVSFGRGRGGECSTGRALPVLEKKVGRRGKRHRLSN